MPYLRRTVCFVLSIVVVAATSSCSTTVRDFGQGGDAATATGTNGATTPATGVGSGSGSGSGNGSGATNGASTATSGSGATSGGGSSSTGVEPGMNGAPCGDGNECASTFCVDGVCCDTPCDAVCMGCLAVGNGGVDGTCGFVVAGTDPGDECDDAGAASCGTNGLCSGGASCALYGAGTECAPLTCVANQITFRDTCNGSGTCVDGGGMGCGNYRCSGDVCLDTCAGNGDCVGGSICLSDSTCGTPQPNGTPCGGSVDCQSGMCVDGVCCNSPCDGLCESCNGSGSSGQVGTCDIIDGADPDSECIGSQLCCAGICRTPQQCIL